MGWVQMVSVVATWGQDKPQTSDFETCCPTPSHPYRAAIVIAVVKAAAAASRQHCQEYTCHVRVSSCHAVQSRHVACFAVVLLNGWPTRAPRRLRGDSPPCVHAPSARLRALEQAMNIKAVDDFPLCLALNSVASTARALTVDSV